MEGIEADNGEMEVRNLLRTIAKARHRLSEIATEVTDVDTEREGRGTRLIANVVQEGAAAVTDWELFQLATAGIVNLDPHWRIQDVNPAFCSMLKFRRQDFLGLDFRRLDDTWANSGGSPFPTGGAETEGGEGPSTARVLKNRLGAEVRIRVSISARQDPAGGIAGYTATVLEVAGDEQVDRPQPTELVGLERAANKIARVGGWKLKLAEGRVAWSEEACAILGLPPGRTSSVSEALTLITPAWGERVRAAVRGSIRHRTPFEFELPVVSSFGWNKWVRLAGVPEEDADGRVHAIIGSLQNISHWKAAEEASRRQTERLTSRVGSLPHGFITLDARFRIGYANAKAVWMLGGTEAGILGQPIWIHPGFEAAGPLGRLLADAVDQQRAVETEQLIGHPGLWVETHAFPAAEGLTITLRDISDQKAEREKLRLLESSVAHLNDALLITEASPLDQPGPRIVFANAAFERLTGFSVEEVLGKTPRILQGPGTQLAELARIRAALTAREPARAELINYAKDGRRYWTEIDLVPMVDDGGQVTHFASVQRDITERRCYQTKLEEQAALLDLVQDGITVRAIDGSILYRNRSSERLSGWSTAEVAAKDGLIRLMYDDPSAHDRAFSTTLAQGHWRGQTNQRRKDGSRLTLESHWTLVRTEDGTPRAILTVHTDITERLALEERLRQSQRLEAVGQLTGGVAHDFNNLLTVILGSAETLVDGLDHDAGLRQLAEMSMTAAERGAALTSQLLAFSRRQTLAPKVIEPGTVLRGLAGMLERTLGAHIDLRITTAPDLWTAVIDQPQLENAVLNLCINARDAMPGGGKLSIEASNVALDGSFAQTRGELPPGRYVMISVSDSGTGMSPEVLAQAFEPFFTTKEVGEGSGLGLSMVYGFMKQSGGDVEIHSERGLGTTVHMYLRIADQAMETAADPIRLREVRGSEKVLLVEDDAMVRSHVSAQLRGLGYEVTLVANAAEALDVLGAGNTHKLLFTDVVMPGDMNGLQLASEAKRMHPKLKVLLTSGYSESAIRQHGVVQPGTLLLNKPYRRHELAEKVRAALDART